MFLKHSKITKIGISLFKYQILSIFYVKVFLQKKIWFIIFFRIQYEPFIKFSNFFIELIIFPLSLVEKTFQILNVGTMYYI